MFGEIEDSLEDIIGMVKDLTKPGKLLKKGGNVAKKGLKAVGGLFGL